MKSVAALLLLSIAACAPMQNAAGGVRLSVEPVSAQAMRLTLDNGETHAIGYNLCPSSLQRRTGTTWTAVPTDEVCTMQLMTLHPGADATFEKRLPAGLPAGEYRYLTSVESPLGTSQVGVASEPFSLP